jgi:hypothetical protein
VADNTTLNSGSGGDTIRTLQDADSVKWPAGVTAFATSTGTPDVLAVVTPTAGLPVRLADGSGYLTVLPVSDNGSTLSVDDGSGSLTVDGTVAATQSGTWNVGTVTTVTNAVSVTDGGGSLTVDDGGSSLTVDGTVAVSGTVTVDSELTTADLDTGAGTDTRAVVGLVYGASGGGVLVSTTNPLPVADGGGSITVDGTVAATQSGTWNVGTVTTVTNAVAVTDNSGSLTVDDGGGSLTVDGTVAVSGSVSVADGGGSLTVDAPVGTPVFVRLSDGSAAISTLPVSLASVPSHAVTNAGTFAVQVDGSALTALQLIDDAVHAEDAAHSTGDKGVQILSVRKDAAAATAGTDGDYQPLTTSSAGRLWVDASGPTLTVDTHAVTQSGTWNVADVTGTVSLPTGAATAAKQPALGTAGSASADVLTVQGVASMTALVVDGSAVTQPVSGTVSVAGTVVVDTELRNTNLDTGGGTDTQAVVGLVFGSAGGAVVVSTTNPLPVGDNGGSLTVDGTVAATQSGTWDVGTVTTVTSVTQNADVRQATASNLNAQVVGAVAHDAAVSGNPVVVGATAEAALSGVTLVADGDVTRLYAGVDGVLITRPDCNLEDIVQERTTNTDGASTAFASGLAAPGSGVRLYIKNVDICNSSASFCTVDLRDGSGGSVLWTLPVPATGGVVKSFNPPLRLSANTALAFDASAATTTLTVSVNGFKSKV